MQETWKNSDDKCTFIILHRETFEDKNSNEIEAMIGDTNIFLKEEEGSKLGKSLMYRISESKPSDAEKKRERKDYDIFCKFEIRDFVESIFMT